MLNFVLMRSVFCRGVCDVLNNSVSEAAITSAVSFKILAGNSSGLVALLASRLSMVISTSDSERISSSEHTRTDRISYANEIQIRSSFNCSSARQLPLATK